MGAGDYCVAQFMSKTKLDVPLVYQSKDLATVMTREIHPVLENIQKTTGIRPVIAYERNNGGAFEMDTLNSLNRNMRYEIFKMPTYGNVMPQETIRLGWDTNSATRPRMLSDMKEMIDHRAIGIYDAPTVNELFSMITVQTTNSWKAQAERHAHDDLVMALSIAIQLYQLCDVPMDNMNLPMEPFVTQEI